MTTLTGDRSERTVPTWTRPVSVVLASAPVVFGLSVVAGHLPGPDEGWAGWAGWSPAAAAGALAVALVRGPGPRDAVYRPAPRALLLVGVLAGIGAGSMAAQLLAGRPAGVASGLALADVAQATASGLILAAGAGLRLRGVRDLVRLGAGALGGAAVAAAVALPVGGVRVAESGAALVADVGVSRLSAVVLLAPVAMSLPRPVRRAPWPEAVASWAAVLVAVLLALGPAGTASTAVLPVAVLVVVALRQPVRCTVAQLVVVGCGVVVLSGYGVGPFAGDAGALVALHVAVTAAVALTVGLVVSTRDAAVAALAERRRFDRAVLDSVGVGVVACDADGRVVLRNAAYRRAAGAASADDPIPGVDDPTVLRPCERRLVTGPLRGELVRGAQARHGPPLDVVADAGPVRSPDGTVVGAAATFTDVTDERMVQARLREAVAFHDAVLAASPDVIFITDVATHQLVWASGTVEPTLGYTPSRIVELDRMSQLNLVHPDDVAALHAADDTAARLRDGEVWTVRVRVSTERGESRWMSRRVTPFCRDVDGRVVQLLGVSRDVTDVVEVERRLTDAATRDPLTGVLNRRALLARLRVLVSAASRAVTDAGASPVLFCDLDGFKAVNDTLGHGVGDRLLVTVARRISTTLRDGDVLARAGGDEFVLLLGPPRSPGHRVVETRADVLHRARTVGRRILDAVSRPVDVQGHRLTVTVSIGIALVRPGIGPDEVLRDADAAMYRAKSTGKNRLHVFEVAAERLHHGDPGLDPG